MRRRSSVRGRWCRWRRGPWRSWRPLNRWDRSRRFMSCFRATDSPLVPRPATGTCPDLAAQPCRPLTCAEPSVMADCGACVGGSMCGRAHGRGSAKLGRRPSRPLRVPSGPGRPSRRRRLTAVPARRSPRRGPCALSPAMLPLAPRGPPPAGHRGGRLSHRSGYVPCPRPRPPPRATSATGMMSRPSFSYAVPNARRTDRLSDAFAKMVSTSVSRPPLAPS
jgi:hypothetical protein